MMAPYIYLGVVIALILLALYLMIRLDTEKKPIMITEESKGSPAGVEYPYELIGNKCFIEAKNIKVITPDPKKLIIHYTTTDGVEHTDTYFISSTGGNLLL